MKLDKSYQPDKYESDIYALWEQSGSFKPIGGKPYALVVPPPNANGNLHMGHALSFAIQDIAARYHRSKGDKVLFVPGADHAGFETQVVYERELEKQGKSRFDRSRERLYKEIYDFVLANRNNFETQIRSLGASVDWDYYTFTLDEKIVNRAYSTFKTMWDEGLIYRGERLVNFCTFHGTAFADIEVVYREEKGHLWQIRYPLVDGSGDITVATTRPETMLGDTAVAVNPNDDRYKNLVGKTLRLPLTNREIPIIADEYVDPEFGTGAVKITPAHDPNDFEVGQRHDLPAISIIGFDGRLNHEAGERFRNLSVIEGREAVVDALKQEGFLLETKKYDHSVGHCYKCDTAIEPLLKEQWFIDIKPLAQPAIKALREGKVMFMPEAKKEQLIRYLESIKDWNISRQIAWGIPIPAFQNEDDPGDWIYDERVDQEIISLNNRTYRRDPDVFDTWFSSSSWPYATLGYPDSAEYREFYPLALMETGFDILMPWVSRMLMFGLYVTGEVPFKTVYLHGLIMDQHGQKMSKSKGNVINPIDLLKDYGSDALRIGVLTGQTPGSSQPFTESKLVGGRNFCNKLWNVARFIESKSDDFSVDSYQALTTADHWILSIYNNITDHYVNFMDGYRFFEAYELVYHFIWDDLADWYLEASKSQPNNGLLVALLEGVLILAHPFAPFLTETIWQNLFSTDTLLSGRPIKQLNQGEEGKAADFKSVKELITNVRSTIKAVRAENVTLYYHDEPLIQANEDLIKRMAKLKDITQSDSGRGFTVPGTLMNAWLDISQDKIKSYVDRLDRDIETEQTTIQRMRQRLDNPGYINNAPKGLIEQSREELATAEQKLDNFLQEKLRYKDI